MPAFRVNSENDCLDLLEHLRWGDARKPTCPWTGSPDCKQIADDKHGRKQYYSKNKRKTFNVGTNTIFHNAQKDLTVLFDGVDEFVNGRKGISSDEMGDRVQVQQSTAHRLQSKLRAVFAHPALLAKLGCVVQADETYYGQLLGNMHNKVKQELRKMAQITGDRTLLNKTPVFGMVDEFGKVFSTVVRDTTANTLIPIIKKMVKIGSIFLSDEFAAYKKLPAEGYHHLTVNHSKSQFSVTNGENLDIHSKDLLQNLIREDPRFDRFKDNEDIRKHFHNNRIEKYWAEQKGVYHGTYHHIENLELFCKEMDFRRNYKDLKPDQRMGLVLKHCEWTEAHVPLLQQKNSKPNIVQQYLDQFKDHNQANKTSLSISS